MKFEWFCQVGKFVVLNNFKNFLEVRRVLLQLSGRSCVGGYFQQLAAAGISGNVM